MRIDLYENIKSQFGVLTHFEKCLQNALKRKNIASRKFLIKDGQQAWIDSCLDDFPDYTVGFNVMPGLSPSFDAHGIPHISLLVDTAPYFTELLAAPNAIAATVDEDSAHFFQLMGHARALFLPHAIEREALLEACTTKRSLEIVFAGTFIDPDSEYKMWQERFSKPLQNLFAHIVEQALSDAEKGHLYLFIEAMKEHPEFLQEIRSKNSSFLDSMVSIEKVMRGRERCLLLHTLQDFDLHIFGAKSDEALWKKYVQKAHFHGPLSFEEMIQVFKKSRIVLNSVPMFKTAVHERLLYALAGGASVLTNQNLYLEEYFPESRAVGYFKGPSYKEIRNQIQKMLSNEEKRLSHVEEMRKVIAQHHTWDNRVETLVSYLKGLEGEKREITAA